MMSRILRATVLRRRMALIRARAAIYDAGWTRDEIERFQAERFNEMWKRHRASDPFYAAWAAEHGLPESIEHVSELERFPELTKPVLVARSEEVFRGGQVTESYSTGGSSGVPARFPRGPQDADGRYANSYLPRLWWGVQPLDSYVHLWGHSHLFGSGGFRTRVARAKRSVADRIVNAHRLSAYDTADKAIARYVDVVRRKNPVYLIGYASALCRLAQQILREGDPDYALPRLRVVVTTAETLLEPDVELLTRAFGVPVVTEYGAVETGVMAASRGGTFPLQVLWQSVILRVDAEGEIFVTTLDERAFPLINYRMGDVGVLSEPGSSNALQLERVLGRSQQDYVTMTTVDGEILRVTMLLPVQILKTETSILTVQFRQLEPGRLLVFLTATTTLDLPQIERMFRRNVELHHSELAPDAVSFEQADSPVLTLAGKQALFV